MHTRRLAYFSLHPLISGEGPKTHVETVVAGLRRRGWDVRVFSPETAGANRRRRLRRLLAIVAVQWRLFRNRRRFDVLYGRHHPFAVLTALWASWNKVPRLEEVNGPVDDIIDVYPALAGGRSLLRAAARYSLARAQAVVVVTDALVPYVRELAPGAPEPAVIGNGVDLETFNPAAPLSVAVPPRYAVFVGALSPWQGLDAILEAVAAPSWPDDVDLVIAGDGPMRDDVTEAARKSRRIVYLGAVDHRQVPGLLASAVASLVPKSDRAWHQSPLKLYESIACATPVIATRTFPDAQTCERARCGIFVDRATPLVLADAVRALAENEAERREMGRRARTLAQDGYAWDTRIDRLDGMLAELIKERAA